MIRCPSGTKEKFTALPHCPRCNSTLLHRRVREGGYRCAVCKTVMKQGVMLDEGVSGV